MSLVEVAVTTDGRGGAVVWEPKGGTVLMSYKGASACNSHALCMLGQDYLLGVEKGKPLITAWRINSQERETSIRLLCPGRITAMQSSPDAFYIAVGITDKLHVYQVASGCLLAIASTHFQPITVVTWSKDSCFIATGGEDGMVCVWSLSHLVARDSVTVGSTSSNQIFAGQTDTKYTWVDHALPVSDIYITHGGTRARLVSVSADRFCKIYDLSTGAQLVSIEFESRLTAVTLDSIESTVFLGTSSGTIITFSIREPPRTKDYLVGEKDANLGTLTGHSKAITGLSMSIDGSHLISSSNDETVRVWHVRSSQCLRTLYHKGPVTNVLFTLAPKSMNAPTFEPSIVLRPFEKSSEMDSRSNQQCIDVFVKTDLMIPETSASTSTIASSSEESSDLQKELKRLKKINSQLFQFAINKILNKTDENKVEPQSNGLSMNGCMENENECQSKQKTEPMSTNGVEVSVKKFKTNNKRKKKIKKH